MNTVPNCMTAREPKRCRAQPWIGPSSPLSNRFSE
jgi:hypothetical protein